LKFMKRSLHKMNRIEEAAYFILATGWGRIVLFGAIATTAYILGH